MLSIYTLKSAEKSSTYYEEDDYYAKEELQDIWWGKGAELLQVHGKKVLVEEFKEKLEGKLTKEIVMEAANGQQHRPGYDLTFSAPKSVSILAIIGKDARLIKAHQAAVDAALNYIEQNYAATRVKIDGKTQIKHTNNLLIAKFEHTDSRALDPDLHTHAVVMNATCKENDQWRTLYFDEIYNDKKFLGAVYRGYLVQELMQAGFEITQTSAQGFFELKNFPEQLIQQFSKRRQEILEELAKTNTEGGKAAQIANFNTREKKTQIPVAELEATRELELQQCGCSKEWLQDYSQAATARGVVTPPNPYMVAEQAITKAIGDLSEWRSVFTSKDLIKTAVGFSVISFSKLMLEHAMQEQVKNGALLYLGNGLYTTQSARDLEINNVVNMRQDQNKVFPMVSILTSNYLATKEQQEVGASLKMLLTNTDRQIVVLASEQAKYVATIGKLVDISYQTGYYPVGITQTLKRKTEFASELGLKRVQTINGFLMSCANRALKIKQPFTAQQLARARRIWLLDPKSSISAKQLNELQNYAKQFGTRIIWGSKSAKGQAAIAGLINHGIKTCKLTAAKNHDSALMQQPQFSPLMQQASSIERDNWQANSAKVLISWLQAKYQQNNAIFSLKSLKLELFNLGITIPAKVLEEELKAAFTQQTFINATTGTNNLITSKEVLELETACVGLAVNQKKQVSKILEPELLVLPKHLTVGQQQAISLILTTEDRVVAIQGVAGAGKTTMLRSLNKLCKEHNIEIIGLTVTTSARERLQEGSQNLTSEDLMLRAGIKTATTRKFLIDSEKLIKQDPTLAKVEYGTNKLIILDEASFVSTEEMFAVINKVIELGGRLVVIGDHMQLSAVGGGRIFYLMLGSSLVSVAMTHNVRFKSERALQVMQHIYQNQLPQALEKLGDSLIEIPDHQERLEKMAKLYLQLTPIERKQTLLITPEHADSKIVNNTIRQGLKQEGYLQGVEVQLNNLRQVNLTKAEQQKIYYFQEGYLVCFQQKPAKLSVENQQYYRIVHKDLTNATLTLEHATTKAKVIWSPETECSIATVYQQEVRNLMVNDAIRWLKNQEVLGICNGQTATIMALEENGMALVKLQNEQQIEVNFTELINQHWEHGYSATTFVAQGADVLLTIALLKSSYVKIITTKDIKVGTVLMAKEGEGAACTSKWVKVLEIDKKYIAKVEDCLGQTFNIDLKQAQYGVDQRQQAIWYVCPDPNKRAVNEIPNLTSLAEFLVHVTRGDKVILLVDHIESYLHAPKQRCSGARSALEYLDPLREEVKAKVRSMVQNITGQAIINQPPQKNQLEPAEVSDLSNVAHRAGQIVVTADPLMVQSTIKHSKLSATSSEKFVTARKRSLYTDPKVISEQIISKLNDDPLHYASNWLGGPHKVSANEARWGKKGSLVVKLRGEKVGYWHNFELDKGGKNLLSLYMECFGVEFKTAVKTLAERLYLAPNELFSTIEAPTKLPSASKIATTPIDRQKLKYIEKIYKASQSIKDSLAEKYLRDCRGIKGPLPADFRFCAKLKHPDLGKLIPALIAPIKTQAGELQGIVRIFLNKDGNKLSATYIDARGEQKHATAKANLGSMAQATVHINAGIDDKTIMLAEGIETALSVAEAMPLNKVVATLSVANLKNAPLSTATQKIVICADFDGKQAASNKAVEAAASWYRDKGLEVVIVYPERIAGMNKVDFNDVLTHLGPQAISKVLQSEMNIKSPNLANTITPSKLTNAPHNNLNNTYKEISR